jgi:protein involved in polysaccharide export with SLBB domain/capsular polysaccharide biosynthesis protein
MNENSDAREGDFRKGESSAEDRPLNHPRKPAQNATNGFHTNGHRSQPKVDFWVVVDSLTHRWHWLAIGALVFGAAFFELGSWYVKPKFTANAQLLRDDTSSEFFKQTPMTPETFAGLLRSPELLRRVGAQADPPIPPEKLTKLIKIEPEPDSDLVKVQLAATAPNEAVELLNCFLQQAVAFTKEFQKNQAAKLSNEYLKKQVAQMDGDIKVLQEQFRGFPMASQTNLSSQVGENSTTVSQAPPALSPSQLLAIQKQRERLDALFTQLNELLAKYTEKHPSVQATREQIEDLQKQLAKLPPGITNSQTLASQVANSLSRPADAINPESQILQIRLLSLEEAHAQLRARQREAELYASNPPGLAHVFAEASMKTVQAGMRGVKIGIVSVFGGCVGLGATLALILLIELLDRRLRTTEDLVRVTKLPLLTSLGDLERMETTERTQWAFRTWTMLQGRLSPSANHGLVCGITSSEMGEGRSTWIKLLAEAASMTGFRVLTIATRPSPSHFSSDEDPTGLLSEGPDCQDAQGAVEANGHTPEANGFEHSKHSANGNGSQALASNVLTSPAKVAEQLTGPNSQPVVHIPLPGWVWNLERRKQWREALNHWREIDNLVILVELPPASVPEAVLLGSNLPNLVWLADSGKADAAETRVQLNTLRDARCNLVGAVLNREQSVPLRKRFPRWIGCFLLAFVIGVSNALAQTTAPSQNEPALAGPAPVQLAVAQPVNRAPSFSDLPGNAPEPAMALQTNLAFSVVSPSQRAAWQQHLTLGPGDVLNLGLYGAPELARAEVSVGPDGRISYLEAQDVRAEGLSIDELRAALDKELANYRRAPRTMITPVAFRSKRYYILGKVMTKGVYTLDRPMTVLEAVARAHGLENGLVDRNVVDLADFQRSFLARGGKRYPLNFEKLFQDGDLSQNVPLEPGDYIYFPATDVKEVYVVGEVRLPGAVTYSPAMTIMAAITERGGYSERAYKTKVVVVRGSLNTPEVIAVNTHAILDGKEPDFKLQPRDIIYVNSRPFIRVEELADLAATAFIQSLITSWVGIDLVRPFSHNPIFK